MRKDAKYEFEKMRLKEKHKKLKKNLRMYYLFRVLCSMNFVMPMFMLFLIDKGLSGVQIMVTQGACTAVELLLTVPSGAFADKVGRKRTLIISTMLYAAAFTAYGYSNTFIQILLAEVVFAASSALFHGTGEAFLYDALAEAKQEKKYKKVLGTSYAIQSVFMGIAAVAGGLMAKYDLALPFLTSALPVSLSMIPLFFLKEPKRSKPTERYWPLIRDSCRFVAKNRRLRNIFYFSAVMTVVGFGTWMMFQPLLINMGLKVEYLGFAMMAMSMVHGLGNKLSERFEKRFGHLDLLLVFTGARILILSLIWLGTGYYIILWGLLLDLVGGIAWPIISELVNSHAKAETRATVMSLSSMSGTLAFTLMSPIIGLVMDVYDEKAVILMMVILLIVYGLRQTLVLLVSRMRS